MRLALSLTAFSNYNARYLYQLLIVVESMEKVDLQEVRIRQVTSLTCWQGQHYN